ncbi:MAG: hypothetical protein GY757_10840 [bacterium]|nr:hypothetical protein [bacterium]
MKRFTVTLMVVPLIIVFAFTVLSLNASQKKTCTKGDKNNMNIINNIAESYVKLAFQLGQHDEYYVDAYFGPDELKKEAEKEKKSLKDIILSADNAIKKLQKISPKGWNSLDQHRLKTLLRLLQALQARARFVSGEKMTFDQESMALYDAVSPTLPDDYYDKILKQLDALLPGKEPLGKRVTDFNKQFIIPPDKVETVFKAAIVEGRKRTKEHFQLAKNESFDLEFVTDKPWGAYNWYKGNSKSLIQVNMDVPIFIDRAIDLACHEGYPGHHVYYCLIEKKFYKENGWIEFSIYPLYSPESLIAEGTANFGIEVAFPGNERIAFEKEKLFPLAGLNADKVELYYKVRALMSKLSFAGNDPCRLFVDGKVSKEQTIQRLLKYRLRTRAREEKYISFVQRYRSYIINYNLGYKMVKEYIEKRGGTADKPQKRWDEFVKLLSSPLMPSDLKD